MHEGKLRLIARAVGMVKNNGNSGLTACAASLLLFGSLLFGQTSSSAISGIVHDASGAVVPGAIVRAVHDSTGSVSVQSTTDSGLYSFASLPVGSYTVSAELTGFKTTRRLKNELAVGTSLSIDLVLEVGEA